MSNIDTNLLFNTVKTFGQTAQHALVVGDVMLDRYLVGEVSRISPEAPVPVVLLKSQNERAGGAANVAANLALLGIKTQLIGCIGQDNEGKTLIAAMQDLGVGTKVIVESNTRPTIAKTRILGGHQQMMRLDQEETHAFSDAEARQLQAAWQQAIAQKPAIVILSDYAKGVLSEAFCQQMIKDSRATGIPVLVDPKGKDYSKYVGATALTPNKKETAEACETTTNDPTLIDKAQKLKDCIKLDFLAVTRGEEGISLLDESRHDLAATAKQVYDVSGAGDTVISTLAAGMMHGLSPLASLQLANTAAAVVVGKVGTVPIQQHELLEALTDTQTQVQAHKVCELQALLDKVAIWKQNDAKIVFTNGCFDLLHAGHVTYLEAAKKCGDRLILGLNTDRSVSALKGPTRPVVHEKDRARVLAALESVDAVILFDQETPLDLINAIKPDVIAKGSDYTEDQVVGAKEVKSWGGEVALVELVEGRSTTSMINKMNS